MGDYIKNIRKKIGHETIIMPCSTVIIYKDSKILLQLRSDDNTYSYHGGAIEVDEDVISALKREIKEELNLEVNDLHLLGIYSGKEFHHIYPNKDEVSAIDIVYYTSSFSGEIKFNDKEVKEVRWFDVSSLPENISSNHLLVINDFINRIIKNESK